MSDRTEALALLQDSTLALRESTLNAWCQALSADSSAAGQQAARQPAGARRTPSGAIGTFGFIGSVCHRPNILSFLFGGTSIVEARRALTDLVEEPRVETILIEFDTPGGGADGLVEFAAELRAARQKKPIIGFINTMCCRAGYWLASQCTELICTPSGETGSVGVFMVHSDFSQMNERIGYKPTYIGTPRYKAEGNPDSPLGDDTGKYLQAGVDRVYGQFVADIVRGRGRGLTADTVRKNFGEGRVVPADEALRKNMVDRIVAYPSEALTYAAGYTSQRRAEADLDYVRMGIRIAELGG
jgi:signal peptide peptidase SppA